MCGVAGAGGDAGSVMMDTENFEQVSVPLAYVGDAKPFLKGAPGGLATASPSQRG